MALTLDQPVTVENKARELCAFIVDQEEFQQAWSRIEAFLEDEAAREVYQDWREASDALARAERSGAPLTEAHVLELELRKEALLANTTAVLFAESEAKLNDLFGTVTRLLQKTLQLGRVPSEQELSAGECCGGGCGCA